MLTSTSCPILLLHGALGSATQLEPLKQHLEKHHTVHTLNFSGHGGLPMPDAPFGAPLFIRDVLVYLQEKGIPKVDIMGYSMGGYVALSLARKHPEKVKRIFTLGTKFDWTPASAAREIELLDPNAMLAKVPQFAEALQQRHAPNDWKEMLSKTAEMMTALGSGSALTPTDFKSITQQVMITRGSRDKTVSEEVSRTVAETIPHGAFHAFEGFKHPIEMIEVSTLVQEVMAFFGTD